MEEFHAPAALVDVVHNLPVADLLRFDSAHLLPITDSLAPILLHKHLSIIHSWCDLMLIDWRGAEQQKCMHSLIGLFGEIAAQTAGWLASMEAEKSHKRSFSRRFRQEMLTDTTSLPLALGGVCLHPSYAASRLHAPH